MSHDLTSHQGPLSPYPAVAPAVSLPGAGTVDLVDIVRRNFWLILGYTILCVSAAVAHVVLARPSYRAEAAIRIEDRRQPIPALDVLALYRGNELSTEIEMLQSRRLAEDVVDALGMQLEITKPRGVPREQVFTSVRVARDAPAGRYMLEPAVSAGFVVRNDSSGAVFRPAMPGEAVTFGGVELEVLPQALELGPIAFSVVGFDDAVRDLQSALSIKRRNPVANIVDVIYRGPDPRLVQAVPNLLATRFIIDRQNTQQTETRSTATFLRAQTVKLAAQLRAAEDSLERFREAEHIVSLPEQASSGVSHFAELQAQRNALDAERRALGQLLSSTASSGLGSAHPTPFAFPTLLRNQVAASLLGSLAQAEDRRSELLSRRSPQDADVQVLTRRIEDLSAQLRGIAGTYLQGLTDQVAAIDLTLAKSNAQLQTIPAKEIRLAQLERNVTGLGQIYMQLQSRLKESEIAEAAEDPSVRLVDPALLPREPVSPRRALSVALALLGGLILGLCAALIKDYLDRAIHTRHDVLAVTGRSVLGVIPHAHGDTESGNGSARGRRRPIAAGSPAEHAEAFVRLAASLRFAGPTGSNQVVTVTSALSGEGKTTSAVNLAVVSATGNRRVLLIDADLRRGVVHALFRLSRTPGFSAVLAGWTPWEDSVRRVNAGEGQHLDVLPIGPAVNNPAHLLGSADLAGLFARLRAAYDLIVIDSAPMNVVADATLLAPHSDGVMVVVRAGFTAPEALNLAIEQLRNMHAPVWTVLNDMDVRRDRAYGAYRHHDNYLAPAG